MKEQPDRKIFAYVLLVMQLRNSYPKRLQTETFSPVRFLALTQTLLILPHNHFLYVTCFFMPQTRM